MPYRSTCYGTIDLHSNLWRHRRPILHCRTHLLDEGVLRRDISHAWLKDVAQIGVRRELVFGAASVVGPVTRQEIRQADCRWAVPFNITQATVPWFNGRFDVNGTQQITNVRHWKVAKGQLGSSANQQQQNPIWPDLAPKAEPAT